MAKAFPLLTVNSVGTLADNASLMLHIRLAEMLQFARHIDDPMRVAELHNMRIAAKRLRYTMELFLPYVGGANGKSLVGLLDKTKRVQELIGEIHDRDVRIPLILQFVRKQEGKRPEIRFGLEALVEQETAERQRIYADLLTYWHEQRDKYISRLTSLIALLAQEALPTAAKIETTANASGDAAAGKPADAAGERSHQDEQSNADRGA